MTKVCFIDIDGVIFDVSARRARAQKPDGKLDWKVFLDDALLALDSPIDGAVQALSHLMHHLGYQMVLLTGRPEQLRQATISHLIDAGVQWHTLLMRKDGDYRKSPLLKTEEVCKYLDEHSGVNEVLFVDDQSENLAAVQAALDAREVDCICCNNLGFVVSLLSEAVEKERQV